MKTPRQILCEQHAPADVELERIQAQVLAMEFRRESKAVEAAANLNAIRLLFSPAVWVEVFRPARQIWAGFALVWVAIVAVNLSMEPLNIRGAKLNSTPSSDLAVTYREQQRLLAELTEPAIKSITERPRPSVLKPQSQRKTEIFIG